MLNKNSNVPFDQIPHIIINHPDTKPDHKEIMRALYKYLKDKPKIIYSNEKLSINCNIPLRTIERRISELHKMGFILLTGRGFNRRIQLGILFNNTASVADRKITTAKSTSTTAKSDTHNRHTGGEYKSYSKSYSKEKINIEFSKSEGPKHISQMYKLLNKHDNINK